MIVKDLVKQIAGQRLWRIARMGRDTLRYYPWYLAGNRHTPPLRQLDYEVTFKCNARCRMCPLYGEHRDGKRTDLELRKRQELSIDEVRGVLEEARRLGVEHVTFTGGEPFLRKDLSDMVVIAKGLGLEVGIISNGSMLNKQRADSIVKAGLDQLHISIDGPNELHNHIRRIPEMFSRIDKNIGFLRAAQKGLGRSNPAITIGCTISALNQERLDEIVATAALWKTPLSFLPIFYSTPGQDKATQRLIGTATEVKPEDWHLPAFMREVDVEMLAATLARVIEQGRKLGVEIELGLKTADDIRRRYYRHNHTDNNKCLYPWHTTRMNPYGDIYPCSIAVPMGNIRNESLSAIWSGEPYRIFRRQLRRLGLFPKCAKCCVLNKDDLICRWLPRPRF